MIALVDMDPVIDVRRQVDRRILGAGQDEALVWSVPGGSKQQLFDGRLTIGREGAHVAEQALETALGGHRPIHERVDAAAGGARFSTILNV